MALCSTFDKKKKKSGNAILPISLKREPPPLPTQFILSAKPFQDRFHIFLHFISGLTIFPLCQLGQKILKKRYYASLEFFCKGGMQDGMLLISHVHLFKSP